MTGQHSEETKKTRVRQIIDLANEQGRVTPGQIAKMFDVCLETANRYLTLAAKSGEVIRLSKCGVFCDEKAIAEFNRQRSPATKYRNKLRKNTENVIFQECRRSPAMQRVLSFYGVNV
ncbi:MULTISPECIES: DUF977 family protein [Enterobacterales]|uniref:DUF977 family protein n=1 Tax=Enterobacterales TaxID=91347 RepID=UPI002ED9AF3D